MLETLPNQPRGYGPQDAPVYGDNRGPHCGRLPTPPWSQDNPVTHQPDFVDGVDEPTGKGTSPRRDPAGPAAPATPAAARRRPCSRACSAPASAPAPTDVPDLGVLLVGPMARGATVTLGEAR